MSGRRIEYAKAAAYRSWHRAHNRLLDLWAVLRGYCNHCPWNVPGEGGGYAFWRCGRERGHEGLHRSVNYVWGNDGRTSYVPAPHGSGKGDQQPWDRHPIHSLKQERRMNEWHEARRAERRMLNG